MGAALGQSACSLLQRAIREELTTRDAENPSAEDAGVAARARIQQREHQEEAALVEAALTAVRTRFPDDRGTASEDEAPETASLGDRVTLAVTGRLSQTMEVPFQEKAMAMKGLLCHEELVDVHLAGVRCQSGRVPAFLRPNQDDYFYVQTSDSLRICGVLDGHGADGHGAAAAARGALLRHLVEGVPVKRTGSRKDYVGGMHAMFVEAFEKAHREIATSSDLDATLSGVTACVAVQDIKQHWLSLAWVGNCRCALGESREVAIDQNKEFGDANFVKRKNVKLRSRLLLTPLTADHTGERSAERARVLAAGAQFRPAKGGPHVLCAPREQWPGIPVTRCLGNLVGHKYGVIHVPEVADHDLEQEGREAAFVVLATDGIWSALKDSEVMLPLRESYEENLVYGMDQVIERARIKWEQRDSSKVVDDITLMVVRL